MVVERRSAAELPLQVCELRLQRVELGGRGQAGGFEGGEAGVEGVEAAGDLVVLGRGLEREGEGAAALEEGERDVLGEEGELGGRWGGHCEGVGGRSGGKDGWED